jgi:hypothetical protein
VGREIYFDEESTKSPSSQDKTMKIVEQPSAQEVAKSENEEYSRGRKRIRGRRSQGADSSNCAPTIESRLSAESKALLLTGSDGPGDGPYAPESPQQSAGMEIYRGRGPTNPPATVQPDFQIVRGRPPASTYSIFCADDVEIPRPCKISLPPTLQALQSGPA